MPLVSVIIPSYHADMYLSKSMQSVKEQTFKDWEIIVVEDGSKDKTESIVKEFQKTVSQPVRYYRHEENKGLAATRNTAIRMSEGGFIAPLDADDCWSSQHLSLALKHFTHEDIGIVYSGSILFQDITGEVTSMRFPRKEYLEKFPVSLLIKQNIIQPSAAVIRKKVFIDVGYFDESFRRCEDLDLWIRAARGKYKFIYSGEETLWWRKHGASLSANSAALVENTGKVYAKHLDWNDVPWSIRHFAAANTLHNAGRMYFRSDTIRSVGLFFSAWKIYPMKLKYLFYAIFAFITSLFKRGRIKR